MKAFRTDVDTMEGFTYLLEGDVEWDAVVDALSDVGYDGWITAEVPPYRTAAERMLPRVRADLEYLFL